MKPSTALPLYSLNPTALIALTPGVTGIGVGTANNFFTSQPDYSANGRGNNGNQYILDGLDVDIDVNPGTLALVPNADALSEMTVKTTPIASITGEQFHPDGHDDEIRYNAIPWIRCGVLHLPGIQRPR